MAKGSKHGLSLNPNAVIAFCVRAVAYYTYVHHGETVPKGKLAGGYC